MIKNIKYALKCNGSLCMTIFLCIIFSTISCSRHKILSKSKLANIISEIYITDQYIKINPDVRALADTTLIYQAIFDKYGCTLEDYHNSINYYISSDKQYPEVIEMAYQIVHQERERLFKLSEVTYREIKYPISYPDLNFPLSIPQEVADSLKSLNFWDFNLFGDKMVKKFDPIESAKDIPAFPLNKDGLYEGDAGRIVDDSDGAQDLEAMEKGKEDLDEGDLDLQEEIKELRKEKGYDEQW